MCGNGNGKNLSEAWKWIGVLRLQSSVNEMIFGTKLEKLSVFHMLKAGR